MDAQNASSNVYISFIYCDSNIRLFSIAPHFLITLPNFVAHNLFASIFVSVLYIDRWLLFYIALRLFIAFPTIALRTNIATAKFEK